LLNLKITKMENYVNYVLSEIISDVNNFENIFNQYVYATWIIICLFWIMWLCIKYLLLTMPIWLLINMILPKMSNIVKNVSK
jgi:ABC-type multidrug transport system fused ATPase/permease subunit